MWYRYQKRTGTPKAWGTGTTILGTGTIALLHVGTGTSKCGTGTNAFATASLHCSTTQGLSTMAIIDNDDLHLFSGTKPLRRCAQDSKNPHTHKNARNGQKNLFLHKMRVKHERGGLKPYINVALLCIQHVASSWYFFIKSFFSLLFDLNV